MNAKNHPTCATEQPVSPDSADHIPDTYHSKDGGEQEQVVSEDRCEVQSLAPAGRHIEQGGKEGVGMLVDVRRPPGQER